MSTASPQKFDLREFVRDFQEKVCSFCFYFLPSDTALDDLLVAIFRSFGEKFRSSSDKSGTMREPLEMKIQLFRIAWEKIQDAALVESLGWPGGRDVRKLKAMEENVLSECRSLCGDGQSTQSRLPQNLDDRLCEEIALRLRRIDSENRAALILRDVLGFEDEEVMRMLSLRWGVFRHRLHRGRLDLCELLRGAVVPLKQGKSNPNPISW